MRAVERVSAVSADLDYPRALTIALVTNQRACEAEPDEADDTLMTAAQVAALFLVHPKTVNRWGDRGLLTVLRTPGRHRRYRRSEVEAMRRDVEAGAEDAHVL